MMPLLPKTRHAKREIEFIAECLLKASNLVDEFSDGIEPIVAPQTNPYVTAGEMAVRWEWALIALIDHLEISTEDVRRVAYSISAHAQDSFPI
jgi:hypothetical protein